MISQWTSERIGQEQHRDLLRQGARQRRSPRSGSRPDERRTLPSVLAWFRHLIVPARPDHGGRSTQWRPARDDA